MTNRAAERLSREASVQGFEGAAKALSIDWQKRLDGKQIERWGEKLGVTLTVERDAGVLKLQEGNPPPVDYQVTYTEQDIALGVDTVIAAAEAWLVE